MGYWGRARERPNSHLRGEGMCVPGERLRVVLRVKETTTSIGGYHGTHRGSWTSVPPSGDLLVRPRLPYAFLSSGWRMRRHSPGGVPAVGGRPGATGPALRSHGLWPGHGSGFLRRGVLVAFFIDRLSWVSIWPPEPDTTFASSWRSPTLRQRRGGEGALG